MASVLRYPANIDTTSAGREFAAPPYVAFSFRQADGKKSKTSDIILFMPPAFQIVDGQDYEFKNKTMLSQIGTALSRVNSAGSALNAGIGIASSMFGAVFSDTVSEMEANSGKAIRDPKFFNYKEPKAREFTFNYKFEPKNQTDASTMMDIINSFRIASYPTALPGGKMYGVPDAVNISFVNIKTGFEEQLTRSGLVIKEINTTLSEGEQAFTFKDGTPTQVSLQIQFSETALLTKDAEGRLVTENFSGAR
jgi:hypothetical protein